MLEFETKITFHSLEVSVLSAYLKRGLTVPLRLTNTAINIRKIQNIDSVSSLKQCSLCYIFSSTQLTVNNLLIPKSNLL